MIKLGVHRAAAETCIELAAGTPEEVELLQRVGKEHYLPDKIKITDARNGILKIIVYDQKKKQ